MEVGDPLDVDNTNLALVFASPIVATYIINNGPG